MIKFILGPVGGVALGLHIVTTIVATIGGMMSSVFIFTFFGKWLKPKIVNTFFKNRKKFSKKNRKLVTIWHNHGMIGIAFLTPLILTPIGGTILAVSFGASKSKIISYMFVSALLWTIILTTVVYTLGKGNPSKLYGF